MLKYVTELTNKSTKALVAEYHSRFIRPIACMAGKEHPQIHFIILRTISLMGMPTTMFYETFGKRRAE